MGSTARQLPVAQGMGLCVVKKGNKAWELKVNGMPLGITDIAEYRDLSLELEEGENLERRFAL